MKNHILNAIEYKNFNLFELKLTKILKSFGKNDNKLISARNKN